VHRPCAVPGAARLLVESSNGAPSNSLRPTTGWQKTADAPLVPTATALGAYEATARATYQAASGIAVSLGGEDGTLAWQVLYQEFSTSGAGT